MLTKSLIVLSVFVLLSGCATYSKILVNANRRMVRCAMTGRGLGGMAAAKNAVEKCVSNYKAAGFLELEEAGVTGIEGLIEDDKIVRILKVLDNSPASEAGIRAGNLILAVDGQKVTKPAEAFYLMFGRAGTSVTVSFKKDDNESTVTLIRESYPKLHGTEPK